MAFLTQLLLVLMAITLKMCEAGVHKCPTATFEWRDCGLDKEYTGQIASWTRKDVEFDRNNTELFANKLLNILCAGEIAMGDHHGSLLLPLPNEVDRTKPSACDDYWRLRVEDHSDDHEIEFTVWKELHSFTNGPTTLFISPKSADGLLGDIKQRLCGTVGDDERCHLHHANQKLTNSDAVRQLKNGACVSVYIEEEPSIPGEEEQEDGKVKGIPVSAIMGIRGQPKKRGFWRYFCPGP